MKSKCCLIAPTKFSFLIWTWWPFVRVKKVQTKLEDFKILEVVGCSKQNHTVRVTGGSGLKNAIFRLQWELQDNKISEIYRIRINGPAC